MLFKYSFTVSGCTRRANVIDIDLADFNGSKRTFSLIIPTAFDTDPRWEVVNKLYSEGRDFEAALHENELAEEYIYGKEGK